MSRIEMPGICYCECHKPGIVMMHCFPCCQGECPVCGKNYKQEEHVAECRKRIRLLAAEIED